MTLYDSIGGSYGSTRRQDPRISALILEALGDARSVVNVGAGSGAYEPTDREVLAVEPSATMIAQRAPGAAPALQGSAEKLPCADQSFDAALAVNTIHHWTDPLAGLRELRRVARKRIVILLRNPASGTPFWLTQDYLPSLERSGKMSGIVSAIEQQFPALKAVTVRLAHDCDDGLYSAFWGRPEMYLDSEVRRNISNFALAADDVVAKGLASLRADLDSGAWDRKHGHLRALPELDLGHRLLVAELAPAEGHQSAKLELA